MQRGAIKILRSYYDAAKQLAAVSTEEALNYLMAIMEYGFDDTEPDATGVAGAMFALVKPTLEKSLKMSDGGANGGRTSRPTQSHSEANEKPIESLSEAYGKPTQSHSEQEVGRRKKEAGSRSNNPPYPPRGAVKREKEQQFEVFWSKYPKKVAKSTAKKAFEKVSAPLETLLTAIERQKCSEQWSKDNGQFIPNPATWLNQERWNDELVPAGNTSIPKGASGELGEAELEAIRRVLEG